MQRELITYLVDQGERPTYDFSRLQVQADFLVDADQFKMMSGSFATGKSTVLCAHILEMLLIPNNLGYLGRLDGKALRASTMQTLFEMLPSKYYTKNDQQGRLTLHKEWGGSTLIYGDFKDINDLKNIPLGFFAIDQCEEVGEEIWKYLAGRLRRRNPILTDDGRRQYKVVGDCRSGRWEDGRHLAYAGDTTCKDCHSELPPFSERAPKGQVRPWDLLIYPRYGFGACNPEGPSHWIFKKFPGLPTTKDRWSEGEEFCKGYHANLYDALEAGFVDDKYVETLEREYASKPVMAQRYIWGIWVEAEGLVYPDWNRGLHVLPQDAKHFLSTDEEERFVISPSLPQYEYIDHGLTSPTAVGFLCVEQCDCGCGKENYYIHGEHYVGQKPVSYHANCIKTIRETFDNKTIATYLDNQAFSRTLIRHATEPDKEDELYRVSDEYNDNDIWPVPNQKDWDAGYNRITEALQRDPQHTNPYTGEVGAPHLFVTDNCAHFVAEIEGYKWKKRRGAQNFVEEPEDKDDHHMDGLNGLLTSRPGAKSPTVMGHPLDPDPAWVRELDEAEFLGQESHMAA